jgi:NAD(P)-dependent dehydrogenase (short-subunit alcohol dehydrogenase family)
VAIAYAREGADIAIGYLPEEDVDAQETARWVREAGRTCVLVPADLRDEDAARGAVRSAVDGLGGLDVLVNNAGYQMARRESFADVRSDDLDRVMKTNLYALVWVTQEALGHLDEGSAIVNCSSIQAYQPSESLVDYASTKAAINNITVNLASELGTPLQPATQPPEKVEKFGLDTPLGRPGQPAEVAHAFVFLASSTTASYVSGTVLGVTGGKPVF